VAGELVQGVLAWVREHGLRVRPTCSYVAAYMRRHPETHDSDEGQGGKGLAADNSGWLQGGAPGSSRSWVSGWRRMYAAT
jgi:hypothetical protein